MYVTLLQKIILPILGSGPDILISGNNHTNSATKIPFLNNITLLTNKLRNAKNFKNNNKINLLIKFTSYKVVYKYNLIYEVQNTGMNSGT